MKLVLVHAVLLISALGVAYQTWTRDESGSVDPSTAEIWNAAPDEVASIVYESNRGRLVLEHRQDDRGSYLWATFSPGEANARSSPLQFQVGEQTEELLEGFASPRALRDLGTVDVARAEEYGLADDPARLSVNLSSGETRQLLIGGPTFGSGARYVRDAASERVYALPAAFVDGLENPEMSLYERRAHPFSFDDVASITLSTAEGERTMVRAAEAMFGRARWAPADAPDAIDQTFANFMDRIRRLSILNFAPELSPESLEPVLRMDYTDADETRLGHLELLREDREDGTEYYVATRHIRGLARVPPGLGESLDQDVQQLF